MPGSESTDASAYRAALSRALFAPQRIALFGAAADPSRLVSRPQRVLRRHGYRGTIVPIDPTAAEIGGDPAYASLDAAPQPVDHAFVMVAAMAVPRVIAECAAAGVRVATILSAGFAEAGAQGKQRQQTIAATARAAGMRLLGPNSLGIVDVHGGTALSANAVFEHEPLRAGALSVVSQSGSMLGAIVTRAQERGLGFAKLISVGNECDLGVGELTDLLVDDADTRAILLFLETLRDPASLAAAARRAFAAGKPVIAFKLGRSALGRGIAATHTGAIVGSDEVAGAFFRAHGIIRVDVFEALFETAQLVLGHRPPRGRRVGALTVSGGAAAMVIDGLGVAGIDIVPPTPAMIGALGAKRIRIAGSALIDLPMGRADGGAYAAVLDELLASEHCDVVLAVQGSNATHAPETVTERVLAARRGAKPLAVFVGGRAAEALRILQAGGVAGFRTPEACADAIRAYCDWRAPARAVSVDDGRIAAVQTAVREAAEGALNEHAAARVLAAIGIPVAPSRVIRTGAEPVGLAFPVAAKILSADIAHKTDVGAVALDIADENMLASCVNDMLARVRAALPHARIDGVLVQPMQRGLGEVIVGFRRDGNVGPVVSVGAGGILAEIGGRHAVALAPVSVESAREMIESVPALAPIRGYRGRAAADLDALAQAVHLVSLLALADAPAVLEAEINPLIVRRDGVVAVDALVRLQAA